MRSDDEIMLSFRARTLFKLLRRIILHSATLFLSIWFSVFCFNSLSVYFYIAILPVVLIGFNSLCELINLSGKVGFEIREFNRLKSYLKSKSKIR
jgi:hypothetical protein